MKWYPLTDDDLTEYEVGALNATPEAAEASNAGTATAAGYAAGGWVLGSVTAAQLSDGRWIGVVTRTPNDSCAVIVAEAVAS